ncbi:Asp23/Gls24 family envelope stress response protein [Streptococcus didelphis]|uniref:Stress response regulator gls24 homolog n=1 Tax=Streptococcus didelphis TaxID=102886 RepID=A0ABY9LH93_9STRE|nr:Asp23/Gls24 family envelope stress response protein [Streptococcus didelphis]WMB28231.1 Asp23/Gls24 family envelope stress response protein [Streptococcus didelphis]WMB28905.1 Asp23/Gls24 family envelope stress response protein [Streptococcus didelphis]
MTETFIKNTQSSTAPSIRGELTYEDKVIEKIVGLAIEHVDGLLAVSGGFLSNIKEKLVNTNSVRDGVNVEVGKKQVAVDLDIIAEYQKHVPTIFTEIKEIIEKEVKTMTDLDVIEVNVNVVDIKTKAQHEADKVSLQDKVSDAAHATSQFTNKQVDNVKSSVNNGMDNMQSEPRVK